MFKIMIRWSSCIKKEERKQKNKRSTQKKASNRMGVMNKMIKLVYLNNRKEMKAI